MLTCEQMTPPHAADDVPSVDEPPAPEELAADLAAMLRTGVTIQACRSARALTRLAIVRAKSPSGGSDDAAVAASNLVREACARVDDVASGPTAVLLGVAPGYRGQLLKERRRDAAGALFIAIETLRKDREPGLIEAVADELYGMDSAYRLRHQHRTVIEENPTSSALQVDWLTQHRSYRRIWTPVTGLRADTLVLASYLREVSEAGQVPRTPRLLQEAAEAGDAEAAQQTPVDQDMWHHLGDRISNLCWYTARFSYELHRFVQEQGGLWLLADAESEVRAADAIYRLELHLPLGETDTSLLRTMLVETPHHELDGFEDRLLKTDAWPILRDQFIAWTQELVNAGDARTDLVDETGQLKPLEWDETAALEQTTAETAPSPIPASFVPGGPASPTTECGRWLQAGEDFIALIDDDWYRVADWYRGEN